MHELGASKQLYSIERVREQILRHSQAVFAKSAFVVHHQTDSVRRDEMFAKYKVTIDFTIDEVY